MHYTPCTTTLHTAIPKPPCTQLTNTKHICVSGSKMTQDIGMVWKFVVSFPSNSVGLLRVPSLTCACYICDLLTLWDSCSEDDFPITKITACAIINGVHTLSSWLFWFWSHWTCLLTLVVANSLVDINYRDVGCASTFTAGCKTAPTAVLLSLVTLLLDISVK